jgi:hypothetical protein
MPIGRLSSKRRSMIVLPEQRPKFTKKKKGKFPAEIEFCNFLKKRRPLVWEQARPFMALC